MPKRAIALAFAALQILALFSPAPTLASEKSAQHRVALVIGNGRYEHAPLDNAVNDARAVSKALREYGFEVIERINANQGSMRRAIRDFGERLKTSVGLFYFAGHGIQVRGRNYLIPIGADIQDEDEIEDQAIDAYLVLAKMESAKNPINIVILDACRNNPFTSKFRSLTQGLAPMDAPTGTIIAFATSPGKVAIDKISKTDENGLYVKHLLREINVPGKKIEDALKAVRVSVSQESKGIQVPWENTSLIGDFFFVQGAPKNEAAGASATALELAFWDTIKTSTDPAEFRAYLEKFPNGSFAPLARLKVGPATTPQPTAAGQRSALGSWKGFTKAQDGRMIVGEMQINTIGAVLYVSEFGEQFTGTLQQSGNVVVGVGRMRIPETFREQPVTTRFPDGTREATFTFNGVLENESLFKGTYSGGGYTGTFEFTKNITEEPGLSKLREAFADSPELQDARSAVQRRDFAKAFELAMPLANKGNAIAQIIVGDAYRYGNGVTKNPAEALRWLREAAGQGHTMALTSLGLMHFNGEGGKVDKEEALRWFTLAAEQDDLFGTFMAGSAYRFGEGTRINKSEALRYFRKCAFKNYAPCQAQLGGMYEFGEAVPMDLAEALRLYRRSAEAGDSVAQMSLGQMYLHGKGVKKDEFEAAKWTTRSASQANVAAMAELGYLYLQGIGIEQNDIEGVAWTKRAADMDSSTALNNLAVVYEHGNSIVKRDEKEAERLYARAAALGNELAKRNLANMKARLGLK